MNRAWMLMKMAALATVCAALGAIAGLAVTAARVLEDVSAEIAVSGETLRGLPALVNDQAAGIRAELMTRVDSALAVTRDELRDTRAAAVGQIDITRAELMQEVDALHRDGVAISVAGLRLADRHAAAIEDQITPALGAATELLEGADKSRAMLTPQALGLVAASKTTMGEAAQTLKVVRDAAPEFVKTQAEIAEHVERITEDAANVADRFVQPKTKLRTILELLVPAAFLGAKFL